MMHRRAFVAGMAALTMTPTEVVGNRSSTGWVLCGQPLASLWPRS
jgi:hypothetical protein